MKTDNLIARLKNIFLNSFRRVGEHRYTLMLYALSWGMLFLLTLMFKIYTGQEITFSRTLYAILIGDVFLLLAPFWLFPNRWKWTVVIPTAFLTCFFVINVWYFRFWGNILPPSALVMVTNINKDLIVCVGGLAVWKDLALLIPLAVEVAYICIFRKKISAEKPYRTAGRWIYAILSVLIFIGSQVYITRNKVRWRNQEFGENVTLGEALKNRLHEEVFNQRDYFKANGMAFYATHFVFDYLNAGNFKRTLSSSEVNEIDSFIRQRQNLNQNLELAENRNKNIILIVVESLNADVVGRTVNGHEVTPVLNSLVKSPGTVYSLGMQSQIADGGSGDGQLIYNSGLLPHRTAITPLTIAPHTTFRPLASQMEGRNNIGIVMTDDGTWWNQKINSRRYGYDNIYTSDDFNGAHIVRGFDGAMFDFGQNLISKDKEPFYMEFITISMHVPFNDYGVPANEWLENSDLTRNEKNYLCMTNYFDNELGKFIEGLKEKGLYDNTIIFIASDHSQNVNNPTVGNSDDKSIPLLFMAVNTGITRHITKGVGQIDVFPTILDIAGVKRRTFPGLGVSMLDSLNTSLPETELIQTISENILTGSYFE